MNKLVDELGDFVGCIIYFTILGIFMIPVFLVIVGFVIGMWYLDQQGSF